MDIYTIKQNYKRDGSGRDAALDGYREMLAAYPDGLPEEQAQKLLVLAADYAHPEALALLFETGASPTIENSMNFTLLHILARQNDSRYYQKPQGAVTACVNILLEQRVSVLKKDEDSRVCYYYAAEKGRHEFIKALAANGSKLNITDKIGNTGIHTVAKESEHVIYNVERAKEKIEKAKAQYIKIYTMQKEQGNSEEEIAAYIEKWMDGLTPDADKERAELEAARQQLEECFLTVKAFVEAGVDKFEKNNYGHTALDYAVESGAKKIAAYLSDTLVEGDDASIAAGGMTLHQAAELGDMEAIAALAATGADLNAMKDGEPYNFGGCTPLAIACAYLQLDAVEALLANGADPSFKDGSGRTAVSYLASDIKALLTAKVFKENYISKMIKMMISAGMDINETVNDNSDTLLTLTCAHGWVGGYNRRSIKGDILDTVLALKADINLANRFGETALMHTCARDFDTMENTQIYLLEQGADVTAADQNGDTALHYAARNRDKVGAKSLCDMLLDFGADAAAVNNAGQTALDIATETDNEPLVKLLLGKM